MKHTKQEILVAGLIARGYRELPSNSRYRKFTSSNHISFFFVGQNGALRYGRVASESRSAEGSSTYQAILELGERQLQGLSAWRIAEIVYKTVNERSEKIS